MGVGCATKGTQISATVVIGSPDAEDGFVEEPAEGVGLGVANEVDVLPGRALAVALPAVSGAGIPVGAAEQVLTSVVTETGFGVGVMLPIGAALPPVDSAGLVDGAAEVAGVWFGFAIGARLGLTGVVRLGGVMLL